MIPENHYCHKATLLPHDNLDKIYHDTVYGFPVEDDNELFERLILEINQAGLNWSLILKKQENFREAFDQFDIHKVAFYDDADRDRLLNNAGIIRNKLKVNATISNAQQILELQKEYGSFADWLDHHHPLPLKEWTKLFKKTFKFTGGEITKEFLMSTGYLAGAHHKECAVYQEVVGSGPAWLTK
ncbi:DNA-3-methyladenine glycosylase I [Membranicola marinus]|uniref:DNA-3-methyladenine glycosylase I n=1 Tax=Membranihabitans marinus TaxID=1227546 RepID=A0A953HMH0_9BACT|nr:DNA-3-methyladenine glycosylase I [Membranihabitans marinus]MBY5957799.1 DNA-3-methyladenine glycosylase I [Membranihabitans marinus]